MTDRYPATTSDLQRAHEVFTPATMDQYALWVETHIAGGGQVWDFEDAAAAEQWQTQALFASENFVLGGETGKDARSIIMADGVTYSGDRGYNSLYSFDDPNSSTGIDVPIFAVPEFKELAPLFEGDFRKALALSMVCDVDPEAIFHNYAQKRASTLKRYAAMAAFFGIVIDQEEVDDYAQEAEEARVAKQAEMEAPEYRAGMAAAIDAMLSSLPPSVYPSAIAAQ